MSNSLQSGLSRLSDEFAQKVFDLVRTAFVAELSNISLSAGGAPAARARVAAPKSATPKAAKAPRAKAGKAVVAAPKAAPKAGRLERRSAESIAKTLDGIAALLRKKPGIGSEEIQKTLGLARNEIARPIALGLANGVLRKAGEKRATKYSAGSGKADAAPKKSAKKVTGAKKTAGAKKSAAKSKSEPAAPSAA